MNRKKMTLFNYVNGVFLLLLVIVCILPILHVIALSLSERIEAVAGNVTFYPIGFTLEAYRYVMEDSQFWTSLRVTLTRVLIGVPANILLVVMTAYPLSKANSRFHARTFFSWLFVITMLFGGGTIPTYIVISKLGLMNTIWALTLPGAMNVSYMILIMNFFRGIPTEIEDAAVIDGANQLQILFRVYLPMSMPSLATIIVGGNLTTAVKARTKNGGVVVWGGVRDLEQMQNIDVQVFYRGVDPTPIRDCQITAFNGPCRIGAAICLPGDIVIGTKNGILFVPSHMVDYVIEHAYKSQVRDLYAFPKLEAGIYTTADVDAVVWNDQMMQALLNFIDTDPAAAKYRGLDWSVELRAAAGDEAAIDELYQQFDIERYGAPGQKKEVLI